MHTNFETKTTKRSEQTYEGFGEQRSKHGTERDGSGGRHQPTHNIGTESGQPTHHHHHISAAHDDVTEHGTRRFDHFVRSIDVDQVVKARATQRKDHLNTTAAQHQSRTAQDKGR
jgi:hypothetical protein